MPEQGYLEVRPTSRFSAQDAVGRTSFDNWRRNTATETPSHSPPFRPCSYAAWPPRQTGDTGRSHWYCLRRSYPLRIPQRAACCRPLSPASESCLTFCPGVEPSASHMCLIPSSRLGRCPGHPHRSSAALPDRLSRSTEVRPMQNANSHAVGTAVLFENDRVRVWGSGAPARPNSWMNRSRLTYARSCCTRNTSPKRCCGHRRGPGGEPGRVRKCCAPGERSPRMIAPGHRALADPGA